MKKKLRIWATVAIIASMFLIIGASCTSEPELWVKADPEYRVISILPDTTSIKVEYAGNFGDSIFVLLNRDANSLKKKNLSLYLGTKGEYLKKIKIYRLYTATLPDGKPLLKIKFKRLGCLYILQNTTAYNGKSVTLWKDLKRF